jgi:hypothetical protein
VRFKHDCGACIALGEFGDVDLYFHPGLLKTVIARRSDEPSDYSSGLEFAGMVPALKEARRRARDRGYLNGK